MPLLHHHLGSQILWCPAESFCQIVLWQRLCQPIVNDLEVTLLIQKNILQFKVTMHNSFRMKVSDGEAYLKRIEFDNWFW